MEKSRIRVGVLGASGYAGRELHALLSHNGRIDTIIPAPRAPTDLDAETRERISSCELVALALPREPAIEWTRALLEIGVAKILDLSDARRRDPEVHYGLPELMGPPPAGQRIVANPGCYPTATLLALQPLIEGDLIERDSIAVLGTSGASGAGKALSERLHFCNLSSNSFPYQVGCHRHVPEIECHLGAQISFVTQLLPIVRGMLVTSFVRPRVDPQQLLRALQQRYAEAPYVTVLDRPDEALGLRHVVGTHQALLAVGPVARSGLVPIFASIDNLMRGAASQAAYTINTWLGFEPDLGLPPPLTRAPS